MTGRSSIEELLRELYAARAAGQLERLCGLFDAEARFKISGSSDGKAIAITAQDASEIRSWLTVMVKTFRFTTHETLSVLVDGPRAAVHWRANIHSRVTGVTVLTESVDLVEVGHGRITGYMEFFMPG